MPDDQFRGPFALDIASIVKSLAERTHLKVDDLTELIDLLRSLQTHFNCRVYSISMTATETRIKVILPIYLQSFPQYAEFLFPPNDKRFEDELKRLESDDKEFELTFSRNSGVAFEFDEILWIGVHADGPLDKFYPK